MIRILSIALLASACAGSAKEPPLELRLLSESNVERLYALSDLDEATAEQKAAMARAALFSLTTAVTNHRRREQIIRRFRHDYGKFMTGPAVEALVDSSYPNRQIAARSLDTLDLSQVAALFRTRCDLDYETICQVAWRVARVDSVMPFLVGQMRGADRTRDLLAVVALSRIKDRDSAAGAALFDCYLDDTNALARILAFHALWGNKEVRARYMLDTLVNEIVPYLDTGDRRIIIEAEYIITEAGPTAKMAVPRLLAALQDTDFAVRVLAADALAAINLWTPAIDAALTKSALESDNYRARPALERIRGNHMTAVGYFADLFGFQRVSMDSIAAYAAHSPRAVKTAIAKAVNDTMEIRRNTAELLGLVRGASKAAALALARLAKDGEPAVRAAALAASADQRPPTAPEWKTLFNALSDTNQAVVVAVDNALYEKRDSLSRAQMEAAVDRLLHNGTSGRGGKSLAAFAPWALPKVLAACSDGDTTVQKRAASVLGAIGYRPSYLRSVKAGQWAAIFPSVDWRPKVDTATVGKLLPKMVELATNDTSWTFRRALAEFARNNPHVLVMLGPYLSAGSPAVRRTATNVVSMWLFARDTVEAVVPLLPAIVNNMRSGDTSLRNASARVIDGLWDLSHSGDSVLFAYLDDDDDYVRLKLADHYLSKYRMTIPVDDVVEHLASDDNAVRSLGLSVLRKYGKLTEAHQAKLVGMLRDRSHGLQPQILDVLIRWQCQSPELVDYATAELVDDDDPVIRSKAIEFISTVPGDQRRFAPVYRRMIPDTSEKVSIAVGQALRKHNRAVPQQAWYSALREKTRWCIENKKRNFCLEAWDSLPRTADQAVNLMRMLDSMDYRPTTHDELVYSRIARSLFAAKLGTDEQCVYAARLLRGGWGPDRDAALCIRNNSRRLLPCLVSALADTAPGRGDNGRLLRVLALLDHPPKELLSPVVNLLNSDDIGLQNDAGALLKKMNGGKTDRLLKHWYRKDGMADPCFSDY